MLLLAILWLQNLCKLHFKRNSGGVIKVKTVYTHIALNVRAALVFFYLYKGRLGLWKRGFSNGEFSG